MLGAFPRYLISGIYMVLSFASLDVPAVTLAVLPIFLGALLFHCLGRVNLFSLFSSFDFILKQNPSSAPSISWSCSLPHNRWSQMSSSFFSLPCKAYWCFHPKSLYLRAPSLFDVFPTQLPWFCEMKKAAEFLFFQRRSHGSECS